MDIISGDVLTKSRQLKGDVQMIEGKRGGIEFRAVQIPIDYYLKRSIITKLEYHAANKLYRDFKLSGQTSGMTINLDPVKGGQKSFSEAQMEARERWRLAIGAVNGSIAKLMIIHVCCYGHWLKDTDYLHYKSSQHAMARFHEAVGDLISHYKLDTNSR